MTQETITHRGETVALFHNARVPIPGEKTASLAVEIVRDGRVVYRHGYISEPGFGASMRALALEGVDRFQGRR